MVLAKQMAKDVLALGTLAFEWEKWKEKEEHTLACQVCHDQINQLVCVSVCVSHFHCITNHASLPTL